MKRRRKVFYAKDLDVPKKGAKSFNRNRRHYDGRDRDERDDKSKKFF